jgi:hypothetical protein
MRTSIFSSHSRDTRVDPESYKPHGISSRFVQSLAGEETVHPPLALQA